jgi:ParB family chromosome partitioning protein
MAALLPVVEDESRKYFSCPIEEIRPNKHQRDLVPQLEELAASIREKGYCSRWWSENPQTATADRRGGWRAAQKAGLREVPPSSRIPMTSLEIALIENIQRKTSTRWKRLRRTMP